MQYLREEGFDFIRPFRDSDIEVRRRWFRCAPDAPPLPFPDIFRSTRWEPFPYLRAGAGSVWPSGWEHQRVGVVQGFDYKHFCGTKEDFQLGALFDPARNVLYDDEWIPECCGRDSVCVTQLCGQEQEHERPAGQLRSYPVPHQDATGATPVVIEHWGLNLGDQTPAWPGYGLEWFPAGEDGDAQRQMQAVADETGQLQFQVDDWFLPGNLTLRETRDADGFEQLHDNGTDAGSLTVGLVGGVLEISGTNALVSKSILPTDVAYRTGDGLFGGGVGALTPILPGVHVLHAVLTTSRYFQLVDVVGATTDVYPSDALGAFGVVIFPPTGQAFNGLAVDTPIALTNAAAPHYAYRFARGAHPITGDVVWSVLKYRADGSALTGTVTSVGISTSSTALAVGGGPITGAGTLTVTAHGALEDLVALAGIDGLIAGDGAGGLLTPAIGAGLDYSGGTLSSTVPGVPTGTLIDFAGTAAPTGYIGCDGSAVSRATYSALFAAIGTTWGAGDGSTTFNLPDFRRRVAVGSGGSGTGTLGNAVGNTGGAETHTLSTAEMPSHTHSISNPGGVAASSGLTAGADFNFNALVNTNATGGGGAHNNLQPSAVVLKCIKT